MRTAHLATTTIAALMALCATPAAAQTTTQSNDAQPASSGSNVRLSIGANYSTGDYGDVEDTTVISVPVTLRYTTGNFNIRVSVPYVRLDGPGSLIDSSAIDDNGGGGRGRGRGGDNSGPGSGGGGVEIDDDVLTSGRSSGIGDVTVAAGYSLPLSDNLFLDTTARVKLPTASRARRLGTGQVDVTTGLDLVYEFEGGSVYAGGRRKFVGNSATTTLRDVWGAGAGVSFGAGSGVLLGFDYDWQQSSQLGNGNISEVTGWVSIPVADRVRLSAFASTGLTTNSSDLTAGASLSFRF